MLPAALERGWYVSFAGNATFPKAVDLRLAATQVPAERILAETDSPYLAPQAVRGKRNEPANVVHTLAALAQARGQEPAELERRSSERSRVLRLPVKVAPKKQLGQHFLVDANILGVIGRLAELGPDDVVLEIGPGHGVLTRYLAERVAHVHAVEIDRVARAGAHRGSRDNVDLVFGDALQVELAAATRRSSSRTSRTTSRRRWSSRASTGCRTIGLWCVMVQREVAERFFAEPGTKAYGAVSVLVQLATERTGFHPVSRDRLPAAAERRLGARRLPADGAARRITAA